MDDWNGISSNWIGQVQHSLNSKRIEKAKRLHAAQLVTLKKRVFTSYKPSVFEKRQKQAREEAAAFDSLFRIELFTVAFFGANLGTFFMPRTIETKVKLI